MEQGQEQPKKPMTAREKLLYVLDAAEHQFGYKSVNEIDEEGLAIIRYLLVQIEREEGEGAIKKIAADMGIDLVAEK